MNKQQKLKWFGYFMLAILILNLVLFAFTVINWLVFWGVIIIGVVVVYKILPTLKHL